MARLPSATKTIAVILALLLAAVATFAIFAYVRGVEQRAFEDAELVEVLVAQEEIPPGISSAEAGEAGLIARATRPRSAVPVGAISSLDQIEGLVAADRILADEVILRDRWINREDAGVAFELPEGFEALAVETAIPPGVAGFVQAGDRVSLIATIEEPGITTLEEDGTVIEEPGEVRSQYVLQGIEVLAVGQRIVSEEGEDGVQQPNERVLMTVALQPEDAERMVFAIENASIYFTLLSENAEPAETPGRTLADLFE